MENGKNERRLRVERHDEVYDGEPTGETIYHAHWTGSFARAKGLPMGVMGRGYTGPAAIRDLIRRTGFDLSDLI